MSLHSQIQTNKSTSNRMLWSILAFIQMGFIYYMSSCDGVHSSSDSLGVTRWLCSIFVPGWKGMSAVNQTQIIENVHGWIRMGAHFTEFALLGLLLLLCLKGIGHIIAMPWTVGTIYAISDEIHQIYVSGRACEITDVVIDSIGVICGIMIALIITKRKDLKRMQL